MKRSLRFALWMLATAILLTVRQAGAQYAVEVRSYDSGATPAKEFGSNLPFDVTASALGEPSRFTDDPFFASVVSPFSSPYKRTQLLSVGESGHATLRLSNYAVAQASGNEIGVFAHASLIDNSYPSGDTGGPAAAFGIDSALVELSADGVNWVSLGEVTFSNPTNGYSDVTNPYAVTPGSVPSDFQLPFTGSLASFDGLKHYDAGATDILDVLAGSGGGTWLDIPAGLTQVGFVRFSVANDGNDAVGLNFELDAVSVSQAALGAATVSEPATGLLLFSLLLGAPILRRRIQ